MTWLASGGHAGFCERLTLSLLCADPGAARLAVRWVLYWPAATTDRPASKGSGSGAAVGGIWKGRSARTRQPRAVKQSGQCELVTYGAHHPRKEFSPLRPPRRAATLRLVTRPLTGLCSQWIATNSLSCLNLLLLTCVDN